jgi:outer membrane protein assembly factor BamA
MNVQQTCWRHAKRKCALLAYLILNSFFCFGSCTKQTEIRSVKNIYIEGTEQIDPDELRKGLAIRSNPWWWWVPFIGKKQPYLPRQLDQDIKRIEAYYHRHGFFEATVLARQIKPLDDRTVEIRIVVSEGKRTQIISSKIAGLDHVSEDLRQRLTMQAEKLLKTYYNSNQFQQTKKVLLELLHGAGYAYASVEGAVQADRNQAIAAATFNMSLGPLVRFGQTSFAKSKIFLKTNYEHSSFGRKATYSVRKK